MSADPAQLDAYASPRSVGSYGYAARGTQADGAAPRGLYSAAPTGEAAGYSYTASAYRATWEQEPGTRRLGPRQAAGAGVFLALIVLTLFGGLRLGPGGPVLSRYAGGAVAEAAVLPTKPAAPAAPAAPAGGAPADASRPAVARHTLDYRVLAPPSVSAATIDRVLAQYNSPAQGNGAVFYDLGAKYGIDPAYALAFYIHESAAGTKGVARFTHGIGNIRTTSGYKDYEGYRSYDTYAQGIEDWYKLIKELYVAGWGLTTPDTILARYAPWGDNNNPDIYAATVKQLVDSWQAQ